MMKVFFSDNVEWSSESLWKMVSADVKTNKTNNNNNNNKRSSYCTHYKFLSEYL